ncbi:MAG: outer membrane homotrimeric porin [Pseudomonadota bacterium]
MKKIVTLLLAAGLVFTAANKAQAVDISVGGEFIFGFGHSSTEYFEGVNGDPFSAQQRLRTWTFFKASENVTGALFLEMGEQFYGDTATGGQLGSDGTVVEVRRSYIDWRIPSADMKVRMGIQYFGLPDAAGGTAVLGADMAGISTAYTLNDNVGITAAWMRPYDSATTDSGNDELDIFFASVPMNFDSLTLTPWVMGGVMGKDVIASKAPGLFSYETNSKAGRSVREDDATMFWVGLPVKYKANALNLEFDFNYGSVSDSGDRELSSGGTASNERSGWLVKGLAEYAMDFGTPGVFAWYGSGDDDNPNNGSEAMPTMGPSGTFTTFFGDGVWSPVSGDWSGYASGFDQSLGYSGTWGLGVQLNDISFIDDLKHSLRVAYWRGTNDPENAALYGAGSTSSLHGGGYFYLTTDDYMVEFNADSTYQIYENLSASLQLGYAINGVDENTWGVETKDGYKAAIVVRYTF